MNKQTMERGEQCYSHGPWPGLWNGSQSRKTTDLSHVSKFICELYAASTQYLALGPVTKDPSSPQLWAAWLPGGLWC